MNIYQKLIEVRKQVPYLQKENSGGQYKYVSSSQVLANCKAKMDELQLLLVPAVTAHKVSESIIEIKDKDGNATKRTITYFTELDMLMTWINAENPEEKISCAWYGQGVDIAGEKGVGKAMTYAEKYFMLKFFNIPTDKDDPDSFQEKNEKEEKKPTIKLISPAQVTRLFTVAGDRKELAKEIIAKYGYSSSKEIEVKNYDAIIKELEAIK